MGRRDDDSGLGFGGGGSEGRVVDLLVRFFGLGEVADVAGLGGSDARVGYFGCFLVSEVGF